MINKNLSKLFILCAVLLSIPTVNVYSQKVLVTSTLPSPSPTPKAVVREPFHQDIIIKPDRPLYERSTQVLDRPRTAGTGNNVRRTAMITPRSGGMGLLLAIPGYSGVLVETAEGKPLMESYSSVLFNPASNVKIATSYAVIKSFGPNYRIPTTVYADGKLDRLTGVLTGNLYVTGRNPSFSVENAIELADSLNRMGIRYIAGDLIVTSGFIISANMSAAKSAKILMNAMDGSKRSSKTTLGWQRFLSLKGKSYDINPSVQFGLGNVFTGTMPSTAKVLLIHQSPTLKDIVKITMCYSNNFLAERLGEMVGGPAGVARVVQKNTLVDPADFYIQTSSGLGVNRVTPRAMMKVLRAFISDLSNHKMTLADVMPVAGLDEGTLKNRFTSYASIGSVAGKTGTLGSDGGVSALSGEAQTAQGKVLFVIFNQKGSPAQFRNFQNNFITTVQSYFGGAGSLGYRPTSLPSIMSDTKIVVGK